tara:strand:- start:258 stop:398 length:141 start_codon:yes stop_codon:yes gene_type:complete
MPKAFELRKVADRLKAHGIAFDPGSGGRHSGKFIIKKQVIFDQSSQ